MTNAFKGCSNMNGAYNDVPNMTAALIMCNDMLSFCVTFNYKVPFNTANVKSMRSMFLNSSAFKQSLATFILGAGLTEMNYMLQGCDINEPGTTTNYDATLVAWAAQNPPNSLIFNGGTSKYGEGLVDNGTTDGAAANKLIQSGQNFLTTVTTGLS